MSVWRSLVSLCIIALLSACASGPDIRTDYDHNADFASYRTFAFMQPLGTSQAGYATLLTERLKNATRLQMESRGYVYDERAPDLLVNFQAQAQQKTEYVPPPPMPWGANYYGYRMGYYSYWPDYAMAPDVVQYTQGVLNIDLIDARRRQMVWEGVSTSIVDDLQQAQSDVAINTIVSQIFARYPFAVPSITGPGSGGNGNPAGGPKPPAR